jgi:hypothetical protein
MREQNIRADLCPFVVKQMHRLMGEGCISLKEIGEWVDATCFTGQREVEIFSNRYWAMDQHEWLKRVIEAYRQM